MLKKATKEDYEEILFDTSKQVIEKVIWHKKERTVKLYVDGKVMAIQTNGRNGTAYRVEDSIYVS